MASYKTRAISIKNAPFAEADKLVTLFTREYGKVRAIAKGARRVPSRFGARVETFTYADYFIANGRSLDIISQCEVIETFQRIRDNPDALPAGLYMLKLIDTGTAEGQHYPDLFDLLLQSLLSLKKGEKEGKTTKDFEREFVKMEGIYRAGVEPRYSLSEHLERDLSAW